MERKSKKARGLYSNCITLLSKVSIAWFLVQKIALGVLARAEGNISSVGQERDNRAIYTRKNKTRTFRINSTAKTRLILEQPLTPVLR